MHPDDGSENTILVLQGGGALGSYQAGAFEMLADFEVAPTWVAGISIGAINAAIICGNPPERRVERLRAFWERVTAAVPLSQWFGTAPMRSLFTEIASAHTVVTGVPGFFTPRLPKIALQPVSLATMDSFYDTSPLVDTLNALVDFDYLNAQGPRLSVGAVEISTGNFAYFDSAERRIGPEHILASGALPPGFPPVEIDGRFYWDGGLVSNTPLQYVMEKARSGPLCIFQIDLFSAHGEVPENLADVQQREKDIRYSSRTRLTTNRYRQLNDLSAAIDRLYDKLPPELKDDPDIAYLRAATPSHAVTLVHLIHRKQSFESASKDYEFSRLSMLDHWGAGASDVRSTLEHPNWRGRVPPQTGLTVFDLAHQRS